MMGAVSEYYNRPDLLARIEKAIGEAGKSPDTVTLEDLAPHDELHIGGRPASAALLPDLHLNDTMKALDVGCGTGGVARYAASTFGCHVSGVDLTPSFIETGKTLSSWLNLTSKVALQRASALDLPFETGSFDTGWMFHVGMNVEQKRELFAEVLRVLRPGAHFLVYDIMRWEDFTTPLDFPLPWASRPETSFVRPTGDYEQHLEAAGFALDRVHPRHDIADAFFERVSEAQASSADAPADRATGPSPEAITNLLAMYRASRIMPVEILCRKP